MNERRKSGQSQNSKIPAPPIPIAAPSITRIKILSVGSLTSGKSCLIKRYCEERFVSKYIATIGVDYGVKPVQVRASIALSNFQIHVHILLRTHFASSKNIFMNSTFTSIRWMESLCESTFGIYLDIQIFLI